MYVLAEFNISGIFLHESALRLSSVSPSQFKTSTLDLQMSSSRTNSVCHSGHVCRPSCPLHRNTGPTSVAPTMKMTSSRGRRRVRRVVPTLVESDPGDDSTEIQEPAPKPRRRARTTKPKAGHDSTEIQKPAPKPKVSSTASLPPKRRCRPPLKLTKVTTAPVKSDDESVSLSSLDSYDNGFVAVPNSEPLPFQLPRAPGINSLYPYQSMCTCQNEDRWCSKCLREFGALISTNMFRDTRASHLYQPIRINISDGTSQLIMPGKLTYDAGIAKPRIAYIANTLAKQAVVRAKTTWVPMEPIYVNDYIEGIVTPNMMVQIILQLSQRNVSARFFRMGRIPVLVVNMTETFPLISLHLMKNAGASNVDVQVDMAWMIPRPRTPVMNEELPFDLGSPRRTRGNLDNLFCFDSDPDLEGVF